MKAFFGFQKEFIIIEDNLDEVHFFEDLNHRRRLEAEVLSLLAANCSEGKMLDIGTWLGHSATRVVISSPSSQFFTVNVTRMNLKKGKLITGIPSVEDIGSFYRTKNLTNVKQIFVNTKYWNPPPEINDLSLVYVDGCHDKEFVYNDTKLVIDRVKPGGFILWHDCSPIYRKNYHWINEAMKGIDQLVNEDVVRKYILNIRNSWIGIWRKN